MIQIEDNRWLSTPETISALGISRSTLFALRKAGTAPRHLKLGRCLYYNEQGLISWLRDREESVSLLTRSS